MPAGSTYKTKQREILIKYLEKHAGDHITAGDVCEYFKGQGASIGQATVYRQLEKLVDEGLLNKYIMEASGPACFEYVGMRVHKKGKTCFHCKCEKCGKLIHLQCEELKEIGKHLSEEHGFKLNAMRTVFYGICDDCRRKEEDAE
ncbi:MAG: transcriptional repressor [Lachnospiraceae bacterium]|nr:transcriptional repressor [Lachnospiraceae bacterium]